MASLPPSQLYNYQNKVTLDDLLLNACDSTGSVRKPRIPAELIYTPFQTFLAELSQPLESKDDPRFQMQQNSVGGNTSKFFQDVVNLMKTVAARYPTENAFSEALSPVFHELLGVPVGRELTPRAPGEREGTTDGAFKATGFGRVAFIMIREDKLGSGSGGGDSLVELLGHYANVLLYNQPPPPSPTILIEVVGPRLVISLAACDHISRPSVSPQVVSHTLLFQSNPASQISALAATTLALRRLLTTMVLQKDNLPPPLVTEDTRIGHNLVFRGSDGSYHKYLRVKEPYGTAVHTWCTSRGYAPNFSVVDVCPTWRRIKMESANRDGQQWALAHSVTAPSTRTAILACVQHVLREMHRAGYVHGDVRAGNLLYQENLERRIRVMLIDFDSAGNAGTARYNILPFSIAYSPGAEPGGLIKAEHDDWRAETVDRFFA